MKIYRTKEKSKYDKTFIYMKKDDSGMLWGQRGYEDFDFINGKYDKSPLYSMYLNDKDGKRCNLADGWEPNLDTLIELI